MTVLTETDGNESVLKITGIGYTLEKEEVESWLKDNGINFQELHLGLREGDKKTVKAFVVVNNKNDSDKLFGLHDNVFEHKIVHVYSTKREQLDRMLEVTGLRDCTVRVMHLPPVITKVDIQEFFRGLSIDTNGIFIPSRANSKYGEAYVTFTNKDDTEAALQRHGGPLLGQRVIITRSSVKQRELAEMRTAQLLNCNKSPEKRRKPCEDTLTTISQLDCKLSPANMLKLTGLHHGTTTLDVKEWFQEDDVECKHVLFFSKPGIIPSKVAYVVVEDASNVEKGLQKDKQYMLNRYIQVFRVTEPELQSLKVPTRVIFVTNLPKNTTEKGLFNFFSAYGSCVTKTMMTRTDDNNFPEAYVEFEKPQSVEEAVKKNGRYYNNRPVCVYPSLAKGLSEINVTEANEEGSEPEEEDTVKVDIEPNTLKLSGLKKSTTEAKIWEWFTDDDMRVAAVNLRKNGVAYVTLENEDDIEVALGKNNTKLGKKVIQVSLAKEDGEKAVSDNERLGAYGYIRMSGLPYSATEFGIRKFFEGLDIPKAGIFMIRKLDGKLTGEAMVQFTTPDAAVKAIKKHRQYMGDRYVLIFPAQPEDWIATTKGENSLPSVKSHTCAKPEVPDGCSLHKLSGLPWSAGRNQIIDWFAEDGVEVKEVYLGWKDVSSGIAFVAVNEEDGDKVKRKHKSMMESRMVSVFTVDKLEFLSTMQLVDLQDHFALLRGVPHNVSAKAIVELFDGLEIEDCGIYALPDHKEVNEVVVQFKQEADRRKAMMKDKHYFGTRYSRIFPCKMHQLNLLNRSTRVEDMASEEPLFPHLLAMSESQGMDNQMPMGMRNRGDRPFERGGRSFRGFGRGGPHRNESAPWMKPQEERRWERKRNCSEMESDRGPLNEESAGEKRKRNNSKGDTSRGEIPFTEPVVEDISMKQEELMLPVKEESRKSISEKGRKKRKSGGDTSLERDISFTESKESAVKDSVVKQEEVSFSGKQEFGESTGKKRRKKRKSEGDTSLERDISFTERKESAVEDSIVKQEEVSFSTKQESRKKRKRSKGDALDAGDVSISENNDEEKLLAAVDRKVKREESPEAGHQVRTPVQKIKQGKKSGKKNVSESILELQSNKSYDKAVSMASDFFKKGGGSFKTMYNLMKDENDETETQEGKPTEELVTKKKKKKRRQSVGFIEQDKIEDTLKAVEESVCESPTKKKKKKKKHKKLSL